MDDTQKSRLESLINLHNEFSKAYKIVESIVEKMDSTTLNDTRYALRAIVDCLQIVVTDENTNKFEETASAAELALRIAWHDVVDITFDSFRIYLDDLGKEYDPDIVAKHINISDCSDILSQYDELVAESRGDRLKRADLYRQITNDHLNKLNKLFNSIKFSEPAIAAAYKKEKRSGRLQIAAYITSFLILLTVLYVNFIKPSGAKHIPDNQTEQSNNN